MDEQTQEYVNMFASGLITLGELADRLTTYERHESFRAWVELHLNNGFKV
jgi:hypothetical protein